MQLTKIEAVFEAILFAAGEAVPLASLSQAAGLDEKTAGLIMQGLSDKYASEGRGIRAVCVNGAYQLCTDPSFYPYVSALYRNPKERRLTTPLLETLAVIAYRQPVTKAQIEEVRGVDAHHSVNRLVEYGLVCELGRSSAPGKPILFGVTDEFLRHFGLNSAGDLPDLSDFSVKYG